MTPAQRRQISLHTSAVKIDFEVIRREIGWSLTREKGGRLPGQISRVFGTTNGRGDVHDVAIALAFVSVFNRVNYIRVPENRVAGLHKRYGGDCLD